MSYRIVVFLQAFAEYGQVLDVRCFINCSIVLFVR